MTLSCLPIFSHPTPDWQNQWTFLFAAGAANFVETLAAVGYSVAVGNSAAEENFPALGSAVEVAADAVGFAVAAIVAGVTAVEAIVAEAIAAEVRVAVMAAAEIVVGRTTVAVAGIVVGAMAAAEIVELIGVIAVDNALRPARHSALCSPPWRIFPVRKTAASG